MSFKHFYFHFGIIGYVTAKYFLYDSGFLNRVLWPSTKKKMIFPSSLLQLHQGKKSSLNDINVSEYCSLENRLSLFHPQAKVSSWLEGIWILHRWTASAPNHSDVQDLLACSWWRTELLSDHDMGTPVNATTWRHPCRSWHGNIHADHGKIGSSRPSSLITAAERLTHSQVHQQWRISKGLGLWELYIYRLQIQSAPQVIIFLFVLKRPVGNTEGLKHRTKGW